MYFEVENLQAAYGRVQVLHQISLEVNQGEIVTLIGANGAGKTTLLRAMSGLLRATSGRITFDNNAIQDWEPERIVASGVIHVPERRQLFSSMTVHDNLMLGAYLRTDEEIQKDLAQVLETFPILKERRKQIAGTLSGGEQQMLAIGRGLMARPKLLLLDEPSIGLAPMIVREIMRVIGELRSRGTTIVLVEQNARAALQVADRGYVLETGRIVLAGAAKELLEAEAVQRAYLGKGNRSQPIRA